LSQVITAAEVQKTEDAAAESRKKPKKLKTDQPAPPLKRIRAKKEYTGPLRTRKVRWYPTQDQKKVLLQWYGASRFVYNACVEANKNAEGDNGLKGLRAHIESLIETHPWLADIPFDIRDNAVHDFIKARSAVAAKRRLLKAKQPDDLLKSWEFKYRSRYDPQQSLSVRGRDWNRSRGIYTTLFSPTVCKASETLPDTMEAEFRVQRSRLGHYYICYAQVQTLADPRDAPQAQHSVVALDPGVRTFQTCYDADGVVTEWGVGDMQAIFKLSLTADKLQAQVVQYKQASQKKRRLRKAWWRVLERIRNKINEVQKKMARWLCTSYRTILLPKFETSRMVRKRDRKLRSKTVRQMCTWAHFRFRELLIAKAELFPWCKVIICDEAYTSKTCGRCGALHQQLQGNKTFKCPQPGCGYVADRDISAARNILLRYLTRTCAAP
jgi:putative transposase